MASDGMTLGDQAPQPDSPVSRTRSLHRLGRAAEGPGGDDTRRLALATGAAIAAALLVHLTGRALGLSATLLAEILIVLSVVVASAVLVLHARSGQQRHVEQRRTEALLRLQAAALDAAANGVVITDRGGVIVSVNPAFTRLTGYAAEEVLGRNPRLLKSGRQDPAFYRDLWETIAAGRVWQGELINRRKDGSEYIEEQTITPVINGGRKVSHFVAIKQDVTGARRLERELREKHHAERVGRVAAGVAHNFNNLLTGIMGSASMALMRLDAAHPVRPRLERIVATSERAARIARQLLAYAGKTTLDLRELSLADLVRDEAGSAARGLPAGVELATDLPAGLPAVRVDEAQVREAVASVLTNAVEAVSEMPARDQAGAHRIGVSVGLERVAHDPGANGYVPQAVPEPGDHVAVSVADTGPGMDDDTLARVFDPFFTTKFQGRGLGLATALGTVVAHRGGAARRERDRQGNDHHAALPGSRVT